MRALILAAGQGTRLRPLTDDRPKCCVEIEGRPLIDWQLKALRCAGVSRIGIVRGYRADRVTPEGCELFLNEHYRTTNMVASLMCGRDFFPVDEPLLVAYSDIVYEPRLIRAARLSQAPWGVLVDDDWQELWRARFGDPMIDAEVLKIDDSGGITEIGERPQSLAEIQSQYIGLIRLEPGTVEMLAHLWKHGALQGNHIPRPYALRRREDFYMTDLIQLAIDAGNRCEAIRVGGGWCEVDAPGDIPVAAERIKHFDWS